MRSSTLVPLLVCLGCATPTRAPERAAGETRAAVLAPVPGERHLADVRQLTFGGENAEAYFSFTGDQLVYQARAPDEGCDRIWRMEDLSAPTPKRTQISSGEGATTCAYFLPGDKEVVYASTHLGGAACPPRPDMSAGYVWALYDTYDVFRANADGTGLRRLTETPGYDAEATVCGKDGSIVFTSVRDGDLELYRMDADGSNVRRLTHTPGYDGGAFFNADCSKIVWRASRPEGAALEDYKALLAKGLVRPSKLELYVANADGSEPVQVTYLNAASFAPYWFPDGKRILFSSNVGDPKGREFDLWMIHTDGTGLERVTHSPGFDGFPMFSPDGKQLIFGSNRATAEGQRDTNLFLARWVDAPAEPADSTAASLRLKQDVQWLAAPEREGRGVGTKGLDAAADWLAGKFAELGLSAGGDDGNFLQRFEVTTGVEVQAATLTLAGAPSAEPISPLAYSASGTVQGPVVLAGYGIASREAGRDDYAGLDVRGKVVLVRRFTPEGGAFASSEVQRKLGDLRHKAWVARERGAKALLVVDWPEGKDAKDLPREALAPPMRPEGSGDAGIPVAIVTRATVARHLNTLSKKGGLVPARLEVKLTPRRRPVANVIGRLDGAKDASGVIVVGAHYDHLGMGGRDSLAPEVNAPHLGADDNASGVAALLEVARTLKARQGTLQRDVVFVAFSAEESGVLGSTHLVRSGRLGQVVGMLNMDMVGRLRSNTVQALGAETAAEWRELVAPACQRARVQCQLGGDGFGPSDHMPFYAAGIPVLHFFTGVHSDYHKPTDGADLLNYGGLERVSLVVSDVAHALASQDQALTLKSAPAPLPMGDRRSFNASLGTIPDYAGPGPGVKGVLLAGVRPGGAAELAGLQRGDLLTRIGTYTIGSVEDFVFALSALKPAEVVPVVVVREGKELTLTATLQEAQRRH